MKPRRTLLLSIVALLAISGYAQKYTEEDPLEGSANMISPDDEDFEASGLPPEEDRKDASTSLTPKFVTDGTTKLTTTRTTESPTTTRRRPPPTTVPPKPDAEALGTVAVIGGAIVAIFVVAIIVIVIICCRRRSKSAEYMQGTPRTKQYV